MAGGFYGADVEQLRALAGQLDQGASRLEDAGRLLGVQVATTTQWKGHDADAFRRQWSGAHRPRIAAAADGLRRAAEALRRNATDQRVASMADAGGAGSGNVTGAGGRRPAASASTGQPLTDEDRHRVDAFFDLVRTGVDAGGALTELRDMLDAINSGKLAGLTKYLGEVRHLDGVALLSTLGLGFDAYDLGSALGRGDEPATLAEGLELLAGVAGIWVPGASLAWDVGSWIGEGVYRDLDQEWQIDERGYEAGVRALYGPGVSLADLTPEQAEAVVQRYEGVTGFGNAMGDVVNGQVDRVVDEVVDRGFQRGVEAVAGPGASADDLTPEQAAQLSERYSGPGGVVNYLKDAWF